MVQNSLTTRTNLNERITLKRSFKVVFDRISPENYSRNLNGKHPSNNGYADKIMDLVAECFYFYSNSGRRSSRTY